MTSPIASPSIASPRRSSKSWTWLHACFALAGLLAGASSGRGAEKLIGNFEAGSLDGWAIPSSSSGVILSTTPTGATLGSSSLLMNTTASFKWAAYVSNASSTLNLNLVPDFLAATALKMDITFDRSLFPGPHTANQTYFNTWLAVNSAAGYKQGKPSSEDHVPPGYQPGFWDYNNTTTYPNNIETWTITFDFTQDVAIAGGQTAPWKTHHDAIVAANAQWIQIIVGTSPGPGFDEIGFIIDNVRLVVPSPAQPGDFDGDGDVDGADFVAWQTNFPMASGATLAQGDADADGDVDGADFVVWQTNFPFTPGPAAAPVPEPAGFLLVGCAAVGLATFARRRSRLT